MYWICCNNALFISLTSGPGSWRRAPRVWLSHVWKFRQSSNFGLSDAALKGGEGFYMNVLFFLSYQNYVCIHWAIFLKGLGWTSNPAGILWYQTSCFYRFNQGMQTLANCRSSVLERGFKLDSGIEGRLLPLTIDQLGQRWGAVLLRNKNINIQRVYENGEKKKLTGFDK